MSIQADIGISAKPSSEKALRPRSDLFGAASRGKQLSLYVYHSVLESLPQLVCMLTIFSAHKGQTANGEDRVGSIPSISGRPGTSVQNKPSKCGSNSTRT